MRYFMCYGALALVQVLIALSIPPACGATTTPDVPSVAFYYGPDLPVASLAQYDQVVIQADQVDREAIAELSRRGTTVFAYVSLSELSRAQADTLDKRLQLGRNPNWSTVIMDAAQPGWRRALVDRYVQPLWDRGFRAFFLDNLDSYQRVVHSAEGRAAQTSGLAAIVKDLHARFSGVALIFNRGFELLPEVAPLASGLVAESLFRGFDPSRKAYIKVPAADSDWLLGKLRSARDDYHLPVTVVDYVPPEQRELARETAQRIADLGMTPWVSDFNLATLGVGKVEVMPRRILAVYNGAEQRLSSQGADLAYSPVHRMGAAILEYFGYAVDYLDVRGPLPKRPLGDQYAGIVTWFEDDRVPDPDAYRDWLGQQIDAGIKVAILNLLGFLPDARLQQRLGISLALRAPRGDVRIKSAAARLFDFEAELRPRQNLFFPLELLDSGGRRLLSVEDESGTRMDAVFIAPWGGMALAPYLQEQGFGGSRRWILDPFSFLKQALALLDLPAPDVTTLNGRRMLLMHIDGDGYKNRAEMPGGDYAGKVILTEILRPYPIKATVSIIEGELAANGKSPATSLELERIAREIFALPQVEAASHSYSHPFDWQRLGQDQENGQPNGLFRYDFSLHREITGSAAYLARLLPGEKAVKVFLWSENAIVSSDALAEVQAASLLNMNGGNTFASRLHPTLTAVSPMGRPSGRFYQVYAPVESEAAFTRFGSGPSYGFREVIGTFLYTDRPRRLKPISIHCHFYSGSKLGSLKALKQVISWSLSQDAIPVYASEYIRKVLDFQRLTLARRLDGCWQLRGDGALTTLRIDPEQGSVDTARSRGVIAVHDLTQGRYVSLDKSGRAVLCLRQARTPHLAAAPR